MPVKNCSWITPDPGLLKENKNVVRGFSLAILYMEINFINEKTPSDKTEKTVHDVFRTAGQIMFNYYKLVLKKDIRRMKLKYTITLAKSEDSSRGKILCLGEN